MGRDFQMAGNESDSEEQSLLREGARRWPDRFTDLLLCIESRRCLRAFDFFFSGAVMGGLAVYAMYIVGRWSYFLLPHIIWHEGIRSLDVIRFSCDFAKGALYFLVVLVWYTTCYKSSKVEAFWEECHLIKSMMAGGFIARPAAVSMGLLIFISGNIAMPKLQMAAAIEKTGYDGSELANFDSCMANSREIGVYGGIVNSGPVASVWGQRFFRRSPNGCYNTHRYTILGVELPEEWGFRADTFYSIQTAQGQLLKDVQGLEHPFVDGQVDTALNCTYVCSIYKGVAFKNLVTSIGAIFAGAAIVVTLADRLSSRVGWFLVDESTSPAQLCHALIGQDLPTEELAEDNDEAKLDELAERIQPVYMHHPGSPTLAMLQFVAILLAALWLAPRGALDGFETVDFHISLMILVAVSVALLLRAWNPFTGRTVIYTKTLWLDGVDTFTVPAPSGGGFVTQKFTLYDWLHTSVETRGQLLLRYCRGIKMPEVMEIYDKKGFTGEHKKKKDGILGDAVGDIRTESRKLTGVMDFFCCVTAFSCDFLGKVLRPWKFCAKVLHSKHKEERTEVEVVTKNKIVTTVDHQVYATGSKVETVRRQTTVCIHPRCRGKIVRLGEGDTVFVQFYNCPSIGNYCDSEGKETTRPIAREENWIYQVPVKDLYEHNLQWSFLRRVLGEGALVDMVLS